MNDSEMQSRFTWWSRKVHVWEKNKVVWIMEDHVPSLSAVLLHSPLVHFEHGATSQVCEHPVGLRAGAPQRQRGMHQAGSHQGSVWFPAEPVAPQPRSSSAPSPTVSDPLCRAAGQGLSPPAGTAAHRTLNWTPNKADLSACQHGDS